MSLERREGSIGTQRRLESGMSQPHGQYSSALLTIVCNFEGVVEWLNHLREVGAE